MSGPTTRPPYLATVRATTHDRDVEVPNGTIFYRAQRGVDWRPFNDSEGNEIDDEPWGYGSKRMTPRVNQATEGRANPAGIPVLYLGTTERTAISEVRPWVGAWVSVAQFQVARPLKALDLSKGHGRSSFSEVGFGHILNEKPVDRERVEKAVWIDIDNAFSQPITLSDDAADYVPTQILAELFRDAGYDAIVYKSQFGDDGFNIVLFNPDDAKVINCAPYKVTALEVKFEEGGSAGSPAQRDKARETSALARESALDSGLLPVRRPYTLRELTIVHARQDVRSHRKGRSARAADHRQRRAEMDLPAAA